MSVDVLGYIYAATVAAGGVFGYVKAQSIPSLGAGLLFGSILGYGAYQTSQDPTNIRVSVAATLVLGGLMGYRYHTTGKLMPAFRELLLGGVSVGGSSAVSPGSSTFHEIKYDLRVNRLTRQCSLVPFKRLRSDKRMFFLDTFNGKTVARESDRHWSQHEGSLNLHRPI